MEQQHRRLIGGPMDGHELLIKADAEVFCFYTGDTYKINRDGDFEFDLHETELRKQDFNRVLSLRKNGRW